MQDANERYARAAGKPPLTTEQKLDAFREMLERDMASWDRILSNLGLTVNLRDLPSFPDYWALRRELFGRSRLALALWRALRPRSYERAWRAYLGAQLRLYAEFARKVAGDG